FEKRLAKLEAAVFSDAPPVSEPTRAITEPQIDEPRGELPVEPASPIDAPVHPEVPRHLPARPVLETKVGLTIVNRVGVVTLVLGVAFFFKWAVDSNWIGPAGRVMLGVLAGLAVLLGADALWRKGQQVF